MCVCGRRSRKQRIDELTDDAAKAYRQKVGQRDLERRRKERKEAKKQQAQAQAQPQEDKEL